MSTLLQVAGIGAMALGRQVLPADGQAFIWLCSCSWLSLAFPGALATFSLFSLLRPKHVPEPAQIPAAVTMPAVANTARLAAMAASPMIWTFQREDSCAMPPPQLTLVGHHAACCAASTLRRLSRPSILLAAVAAAGTRACLGPSTHAIEQATQEYATAVWARDNGFGFERTERFTIGGVYVLYRFAGPDWCRLSPFLSAIRMKAQPGLTAPWAIASGPEAPCCCIRSG